MAVVFEAREYGPDDFTPEQRAACKERITLHPGPIIIWRELPVISVYSAGLFIENFIEVSKDLDLYSVIVDLSGTRIPSAAVRARHGTFFRGEMQKGRFKAAAMVTGKNILINAAARFVAAAIGMRAFSVHKTVDEALELLRKM
jgi:hypothetical protein